MRKAALAVLALLVAGWGTVATTAERQGRGKRTGEARVSRMAMEPNVIGTIQYDTGVNAGFHPDGQLGGNLNRVVGNRFNTALGGPLLFANRVFTLTVFPANSGVQSVSVASGPNSMGTAMVIDYLAVNLMANQFNEIPIDPPAFVPGPEFLGLFLGTFGSTQPAGLVGMSDMATMGQGFHGIQGFYTSNMIAAQLAPVPNRNAMVRAAIDVFPVELMEFVIQ